MNSEHGAIASKDVPTDPTILLGRIHEAFPELAWRSYEYITHGWDHEVLILDKAIVFRFPTDAEYTAALHNEVDILRRLKPLVQVRIPDYTYVPADVSFAGYTIIAGETVSKDVFDKLPAAARMQIAGQLAGLLTTLHTSITQGHDFSTLRSPYLVEDQAEVKQLTDKYLKGVLSTEDVTRVQDILVAVDRLLEQPLPQVFVHGDIYSKHILWDGGAQRLGVIDFSDMSLGDPALDFAELHEYGEDFVRQVYDAYAGPKDDTFLARAWLYQRWMGVYMMTDHFVYHKTSFEVARETFDRTEHAAA